jgi:hypothetical protein
MTYAALAAAAALSSFAAAAIVLSIAATLVSGPAVRGSARYAPRLRAGLLFRLRVLPGAGAAIFGFAIALPTFVAFEPFDTNEPLPRTMVALALIGGVLLAHGLWRTYTAWRATARTSAAWKREGRRLADLDTPIPAYGVDAPYPIVAVVGIRRPTLFIAECVLAECPAAELRAVIAHETAHVRSFDNVRRLVVRVCPDLVRDRGPLTRAWHGAAEEAADADAARTPADALDLAQALIRVARLAPSCPPALASAFYSGGGVDARVRRLVNPPPDVAVPVALRGSTFFVAAVALAGTFVLAAPAIDRAIEAAIRLIP